MEQSLSGLWSSPEEEQEPEKFCWISCKACTNLKISFKDPEDSYCRLFMHTISTFCILDTARIAFRQRLTTGKIHNTAIENTLDCTINDLHGHLHIKFLLKYVTENLTNQSPHQSVSYLRQTESFIITMKRMLAITI